METGFYKSGGTLPPDAPSYITRQADHDLYEGLDDGQFCYVLTSRQMGKSSLRNRTAKRLRDSGAAVAEIDLTAIGRNLSPEQWYDGLVYELGREFGLKAPLNSCWRQNAGLGPLHRLMCVLMEGVLAHIPGQVVIFIDEIEAVRSLDFSADEFFAAIRACYNLRSSQPPMQRLSFCLLGMATPADLIKDTKITPFNIGRRIELTDFTAFEARPLANGLCGNGRDGDLLLARALYWTGGHPYLTQRLCQAVAAKPDASTAWIVDTVCADLFLSTRARESGENFVPVREYLFKSGFDAAGLLDMYQRVFTGRRVEEDETNPLVRSLNLSGITAAENGCLRVRNRIYTQVFDLKWIAANMPDAEVKRQKAAYRKGALRTAAIAGGIIAVMGGLIWQAVKETRRADVNARLEYQQVQQANRLIYDADMNLGQRVYEENNIGRAHQLLEESRLRADHTDLRGFEWRYLWQLCHRERLLIGEAGVVRDIAFSPDGRALVSAGEDGRILIWNSQTGRKIRTINTQIKNISAMTLSPGGNAIAIGCVDGRLTLWNLETGRELCPLKGHTRLIISIAFSADGKRLATASFDETIRLWDLTRNTLRRIVPIHNQRVITVAFSLNGRTLASGEADGLVKIWNVATGQKTRTVTTQIMKISALAFSPQRHLIAIGGSEGRLALWNLETGREFSPLKGHTRNITSVVFSADGTRLASASYDSTSRLWDVPTGKMTDTFKGHIGKVRTVTFARQDQMLASGGEDGRIRLWDTKADVKPRALQGANSLLFSPTFSPDARLFASGFSNGSARLWNVAAERLIDSIMVNKNENDASAPSAIAFSSDSLMLAAGTQDGRVKIWNVRSRLLRTFAVGSDPVTAVAFTPDGNTLAAWTIKGTAKLLDVASGRQSAAFKLPIGFAHDAAFSPDGRMLITIETDRVRVWSIESGRDLYTLGIPANGINSIVFSPDSAILAISNQDQTIGLWNVATGRQRWKCIGHTGDVICLAFTPDGRTLATGSMDHTIKLWDVATGRETFTLKGHSGGVNSLAFTPDGRRLVSADSGGEIRTWSAPSIEEIALRERSESDRIGDNKR